MPSIAKKGRRLPRWAVITLILGVFVVVGGVIATYLDVPQFWGQMFSKAQIPGPVRPRRIAVPMTKKEPRVQWVEDLAAAKEKAVQEKKDILIYFHGSDWSSWCRQLEKDIFDHWMFPERVGNRFVMLKVDFPWGDAGKAGLKDAEANEQLKKDYGVSVIPTVVLADADGNDYGAWYYQAGGLEPFAAHIDSLRKERTDRDRVLSSVDQAQGINKLAAAKEAVRFLKDHRLAKTFQQRRPAWTELAEKYDANNEQGLMEMLFATDWSRRYSFSYNTPAALPPLLLEFQDWMKQHGAFKDNEQGATLFLAAAWAQAELEDYQGAYSSIEAGLKLSPKNQQTRARLDMGLLGLGLGSGTAFAINDAGYFLTNHHVAGGPGKVFLQFPEQKKLLPAKLIVDMPALDLAVIQIDPAMAPAFTPLRIADDQKVGRGEQVGAWGFPLGTMYGRGLKFTKGSISAAPRVGQPQYVYARFEDQSGQ